MGKFRQFHLLKFVRRFMFKLNLLFVLFFLVSCSGLNRNNIDLSQIRCEQSNYKRSLHLFTDKIMSFPEDMQPVFELSRCYYEALDYHRSLYYIDLVLKKETSVHSLNLKANSLFKIGRTDQSQQAFEQRGNVHTYIHTYRCKKRTICMCVCTYIRINMNI